MKVTAVILAVSLIIFSAVLAVKYNAAALTAQKALDQERYVRIVAEEKLDRTNTQIRKLESELERIEKQGETTEEQLKNSREVNSHLQAQLDEVATIKEALERKIKDLEQVLTQQTEAGTESGNPI